MDKFRHLAASHGIPVFRTHGLTHSYSQNEAFEALTLLIPRLPSQITFFHDHHVLVTNFF
jgi:hypothetical protein